MASLFFFYTLLVLTSSLCFLSNAKDAKVMSFSVELIHRDSPKSPFYNPTETPYQRFRNAIERSRKRVDHLKKGRSNYNESSSTRVKSIESNVSPDRGEYLMNLSLGTPGFPIMAILDTSSDLVWTQCQPCLNCYPQDAPLFSPKASSTYRSFPCSSPTCTSFPGTTCSSQDNTCSYSASYGDKSYSRGTLAAETLTLGSTDTRPTQLPNIIIGCGHDNAGTFSRQGSGIVGLGGGSLSLVTQLGDSIEGKFSYCLAPSNGSADVTSSKLNFGEAAIVEDGAVSTPLIQNSEEAVFYYVNLEAITVGDTRIPFTGAGSGGSTSSRSESGGQGNMIVDSGTTLTMLPSEMYSQVEDALASAIQAQRRENTEGGPLSLCYSASDNLKIPEIVMNFEGADVGLAPTNAFAKISKELVCCTLVGNDDLAIYGNLAQMNYLIGYDIVSGTLSFKQTNCAATI